MEATINLPENRDELSFDLGVTLNGGVHIPVEVFLVYPEGHGLHAVKALIQAMETQTNGLFRALLDKQDASLVSAMLARGVEFEDDEEYEE